MDENNENNEVKENNQVKTEELKEVSSEILNIASSGTTEEIATSSSRGESKPQPFKKSIAEMEEEQQKPTITMKEIKALKRSRYDKISENFQYAYVIKNNKTGLVVEVRAASSLHACNIIGWRPRHVSLIEVIDTKKQEDSANVEKDESTEKAEKAEKAELVTA